MSEVTDNWMKTSRAVYAVYADCLLHLTNVNFAPASIFTSDIT